jgi:hypothetical protein
MKNKIAVISLVTGIASLTILGLILGNALTTKGKKQIDEGIALFERDPYGWVESRIALIDSLSVIPQAEEYDLTEKGEAAFSEAMAKAIWGSPIKFTEQREAAIVTQLYLRNKMLPPKDSTEISQIYKALWDTPMRTLSGETNKKGLLYDSTR